MRAGTKRDMSSQKQTQAIDDAPLHVALLCLGGRALGAGALGMTRDDDDAPLVYILAVALLAAHVLYCK